MATVRRALGYMLAGAAGGAAATAALVALAAARAAREREIERQMGRYRVRLQAWRIRETVKLGKYWRGELVAYDPEPIPQFRLGKRPESPLTGRSLEVQ